MMERWPTKHSGSEVKFHNWWGKEKRAELIASLDKKAKYERLKPALPLGLPFVPLEVRVDYTKWPLLSELLNQSFPGVKTSRDPALVAFDRASLEQRMKRYFNPKVSDDELAAEAPCLVEDTTQFNAKVTREFLKDRGYRPEYIVRFHYRPLDVRWLYWEEQTRLVDRARGESRPNMLAGWPALAAVQQNRKEFSPPIIVATAASLHLIERGANYFPLYVRLAASTSSVVRETPDMFAEGIGGDDGQPVANLTPRARKYLARLGAQPEDLFFHIAAILHAPAYRAENAGALRQDWPRVPLPKDADTLRAGAALGRQVAALLDPETDVRGVTSTPIRKELQGLGELTAPKVPNPTNPKHSNYAIDLALAARWGRLEGGKVMPGPGDVRPGTRGDGFVDVQINATTRWKDVPADVWAYTLGGYQVLKKWLSYREAALLGRPLTADEALDFTKHVRRIAALLALQADLDRHYASAASGFAEPHSSF